MYEISFLKALLFTVTIESIAVVLLMKVFKNDAKPIGTTIFAALFATTSTLPYLWFILPIFLRNRFLYASVGEMGVFLVEALFYYIFLVKDIKKAAILSFVANAISFLLGLLIHF